MANEINEQSSLRSARRHASAAELSFRGVRCLTLLVAAVFTGPFTLQSVDAADREAPSKPLEMFQVADDENEDGSKSAPRFVETTLRRTELVPKRGLLTNGRTVDAGTDDVDSIGLSGGGATYATSSDVRATEVAGADDARLFANIRPFKRARERFFGDRSDVVEAPEPPVIEAINPEEKEKQNNVVVTPAKPPVITLASAELPPLDPEGAQIATEELATRADIDALREETKGLAWKKGDLKITPYGFLNLSVSSDTERAVPGEYILYLQNPDVDSSSDFAVDARTSRLGLKIEGPRIEQFNATLGGTAEFDFQGVYSGSKNKGGVQFRRAFAELVDAQHERRFLAGQDWEVISPGAPMMLNYLPGAFAGNIQYRRAQLRFEQGWTCSSNLHFLAQIAACDNVQGDYTSTTGVSPMSSGWPVIEGRIETKLFEEIRNGLPISVGLSGHIGEQYYKFSPIAGIHVASTAERKSIKTWSANVDYSVPITTTLKFQGEYYQGSMLSSFCGAINQGVDLYRREGIDDYGWWTGLHKDWTTQFSTNVGYGIDKPDRDDLVGTSLPTNGKTTARTKNEIYYVNFLYNWTKNFMTGIEFSYWETGYQTMDVINPTPTLVSEKTAKALRTEFTTRLSF